MPWDLYPWFRCSLILLWIDMVPRSFFGTWMSVTLPSCTSLVRVWVYGKVMGMGFRSFHDFSCWVWRHPSLFLVWKGQLWHYGSFLGEARIIQGMESWWYHQPTNPGNVEVPWFFLTCTPFSFCYRKCWGRCKIEDIINIINLEKKESWWKSCRSCWHCCWFFNGRVIPSFCLVLSYY